MQCVQAERGAQINVIVWWLSLVAAICLSYKDREEVKWRFIVTNIRIPNAVTASLLLIHTELAYCVLGCWDVHILVITLHCIPQSLPQIMMLAPLIVF